jgi:hypothetical protein
MIIFDYNQVAISNLMEQIGSSKEAVDEDLVRHMILNTLRKHIKKYKQSHGPEVVIACDSRHYWRKEIFAPYKANRKKNRDTSGHDWSTIFHCLALIKDELKEHSPYKVLEIDTCEADDIIGVLTQKYAPSEKIIILSSDKDFAQLQKYQNVSQHSPIMKKDIVEKMPDLQLKQLIIRGDKDDGIPNILSPDDVFISGGRQKPIMEAKLSVWMNQKPEDFCTGEMLRNYYRNQALIDLTKIPEDIVGKILESYETTKPKNKSHFMNYMIEHRLKNLIECLDEF